ncbi:hypothetical protein BDY24DRAFT_444383 [Mrakia frigida]|uniref:DUF4149 domain-containing protein n=1 Tax=Mrakia frigida TaxID=29902 RepID=UPI003FCC1AF5
MSSSSSSYPSTLTGSTFLSLLTPQGGHLLAFATCWGLNFYQSFVNGPVAYKALPRLQFRSLQAAIFPYYFALNTLASTYLVGSQYLSHPSSSSLLSLSSPASFQIVSLATHLACHALNMTVVGPKATKVMQRRAKLEREEGKAYNDQGVSGRMKELNKSFSILHGISSLLNLGAFLIITGHGLWIAKFGV